MSYLLDTNVLSELKRKTPHAGLVAWLESKPSSTLYLSVLTLGEIRKGINALDDVNRRQRLSDWLEAELPVFFIGRILPVTVATADHWGKLMATAKRPLPAIDSLLAATAIEHNLTLVTRNTKDFIDLPVTLFNPWEGG